MTERRDVTETSSQPFESLHNLEAASSEENSIHRKRWEIATSPEAADTPLYVGTKSHGVERG